MVSRRDTYVSFGHSGAYLNRKTGVGVSVLTNALGSPLNPGGLALRSLDLLSK